MFKLILITGVNSQEASKFSRGYNALAGQACHIRRTVKWLQSAASKLLTEGQTPLCEFFLAYFVIDTAISIKFISLRPKIRA